MRELGVVRLEGPADERGKPACLVLQIAQAHEVLNAFSVGLNMPIHHRGTRLKPDEVALSHHFQPFVSSAFFRTDFVADAVSQNFGTAAGNRIEPGIAQAHQHLAQRHAVNFREPVDFGRRKAVDVDAVVRFNPVEELFVPAQFEFRVQAALHENEFSAQVKRLLNLLSELFAFHDIRVRIAAVAVECAKIAIDVAPIGVVNVPVNDVGDVAFGMLALACHIGGVPQSEELVAFEKRYAIVKI